MNIYLFCIISALLTFLSFFFQPLWPLIFISLAPFLYPLIQAKLTNFKAFKYGFTFGFTFYLLNIYWIWKLYPLSNFGFNKASSFFILLGAWIFISTYQGVLFSILSFIVNYLGINSIAKSLLFPSLWVVLEWLQGLGPLGFPWFTLALPLTNFPFLLQVISIGGSLFVTFIIVLLNSLFALILIYKESRKKLILKLISILFLFIAINYICLNMNNTSDKTINYCIVQGNISSYNKIEEKYIKDNLDIYLDLTYKAFENTPNIDLVMWPETAIPIYLNRNKEMYNLYKNIAMENKTNLLVGAFTLSNEEKYNALYCFNPNGDVSGIYRKGHLVPLGEFIPFSDIIFNTFPQLKDIKAFSDNLQGDTATPTLKTSFGIIGPFICFESIFSDIPRSEIPKGAQILCLASNDSWFKNSKELDQHFKHSVLRAIELNRFVLISANTGISGVIDNKGKILNIIPKESLGYITGEAKLIHSNTPFSYWGNAPILSICILIIAFLIINNVKFKI